MLQRMDVSRCCCDVSGLVAEPSAIYEPIIELVDTDGAPATKITASYFLISAWFTGNGFFLFAPKSLPSSVSTLRGQFESYGYTSSLSASDTPAPGTTWPDVTIEVIIVPRDYVVITGTGTIPDPFTYDWDVPEKQVVTWNVTGAWLPPFIVQMPDIAAEYNTAMALPAGPVSIDTSQSGRVWVMLRSTSPTSYASNEYMRALSNTPPFPDFNAFKYRFLYTP